jgi:hypothetical protein
MHQGHWEKEEGCAQTIGNYGRFNGGPQEQQKGQSCDAFGEEIAGAKKANQQMACAVKFPAD